MEQLWSASPRVMRQLALAAELFSLQTLPTFVRPGEICEREGSSAFLFVQTRP